jgi:hypothetical protein
LIDIDKIRPWGESEIYFKTEVELSLSLIAEKFSRTGLCFFQAIRRCRSGSASILTTRRGSSGHSSAG